MNFSEDCKGIIPKMLITSILKRKILNRESTSRKSGFKLSLIENIHTSKSLLIQRIVINTVFMSFLKLRYLNFPDLSKTALTKVFSILR